MRGNPRGVLDRESGDASGEGKPHAFGDAGRVGRKSGFEIGIHGNVGGRHYRCEVG
jgi:hypothetical protein